MSEQTAFRLEMNEGRVRFSWGDDPLDFIEQSNEQCIDLLEKLGPLVSRRIERDW